jgi:hypothetical protein
VDTEYERTADDEPLDDPVPPEQPEVPEQPDEGDPEPGEPQPELPEPEADPEASERDDVLRAHGAAITELQEGQRRLEEAQRATLDALTRQTDVLAQVAVSVQETKQAVPPSVEEEAAALALEEERRQQAHIAERHERGYVRFVCDVGRNYLCPCGDEVRTVDSSGRVKVFPAPMAQFNNGFYETRDANKIAYLRDMIADGCRDFFEDPTFSQTRSGDVRIVEGPRSTQSRAPALAAKL